MNLFIQPSQKGLSQDDEKSVEDKLKFFTKDTFQITSEANKLPFQKFKTILYTVLAQLLAARFHGFEFMTKLFPRNHIEHEETKNVMETHVEKPYYLHEQSTLNMVQILNKIVNRYLNILKDMVEDKEQFEEMVKTAIDKDSIIEERMIAEEYIKKHSKMHGELVIHGDQLTVARIESASFFFKCTLNGD